MSPLEAAIRAVCSHIGVDPEMWRGFEEIALVAVSALLDALPAEASAMLRDHMGAP